MYNLQVHQILNNKHCQLNTLEAILEHTLVSLEQK